MALLVNVLVLAYFDKTKAITVQCDSSQGGIGAVLLWDGRPGEYASRARTEQDSNAQTEKELRAIVFAMERLHTMRYI